MVLYGVCKEDTALPGSAIGELCTSELTQYNCNGILNLILIN